MREYIANMITGFRILGSIVMLFFPTFSPRFYLIYLLCGISDMIDGTIARKTNSIGTFGAKLDTVADFVFTVAALIKFLPVIHIPGWLWIWMGIIAILKISNAVSGFVLREKFVSMHTAMNKVTGLMLFLLPLTLHFIELQYGFFAVCTTATFSAVQEGYYIRTGREIV